MEKAVAVLHIENDFIVLLLVTSAQRRVEAFVAVNDDSDTFLTAPDFQGWADAGLLRRLRTRDLNADQKSVLRIAFIEQQIATLRSGYQPFEIATNKGVTDSVLFSLFGKGWGLGWKAIAREAETRIAPSDNPAFAYLLARKSDLETVGLGVLFLAHRHGLDQVTFEEREVAAMQSIVGDAGAHVIVRQD